MVNVMSDLHKKKKQKKNEEEEEERRRTSAMLPEVTKESKQRSCQWLQKLKIIATKGGLFSNTFCFLCILGAIYMKTDRHSSKGKSFTAYFFISGICYSSCQKPS